MGAEVPQLELPPLGVGGQLVDMLFEVGPAAAGEPLTFAEITAWQEATGVQLNAWESVTLRRLSVAYLAELAEAADPGRPAPYTPQPAASAQGAAIAGA